MKWCEQNRVGYVFGLARNERLVKSSASQMKPSQWQWKQTGKSERVFTEFATRTRNDWSRARRSSANEYLERGNPRFGLLWSAEQMEARRLY